MSVVLPPKAIKVLRYIALCPDEKFFPEELYDSYGASNVERYIDLLHAKGYLQVSNPITPLYSEKEFSYYITDDGLSFLESLPKLPYSGFIATLFELVGGWFLDRFKPVKLFRMIKSFFD